ncbi:substrate-binding domain-containing protein [Desulfovibrio cuneatus]|uniref:substrate-binding domain-containing protein n=1 Tax=Desulfovibrio cuneatus TaxID=159728 RepID=UPI0004156068
MQKNKPVPAVSEGTSPPHTSLPTLKVAVGAMISPRDTEVYYQQLLRYLGESINANVELVQRKTYAEVNTLLIAGEIDLAFICSGPYVTGTEQHPLHLLSTPQVQGQHTYKSYLIVHKDSALKQLNDLQGKTFAFTDPDSNTGSLVPRYWLQQKGLTPEHFFKETLFTYSHDNSIFAVAKGLVDGAAVDSLIWDFYQHNNSELTAKTRIIHKSEAYGIPPVVAASSMPQERREAIQHALLAMHTSAQGKQILQNLLIDRFVLPQDHWYSSIRTMQQTLQQAE